MTKSTSAMFVAGPPVVARTGQDLGKQELGGWEVQCRAGAVDHAVETEEEAFQCARRFLSYLPASVHSVPERGERIDPVDRREEMLFSVVPRDRRKVYKMRSIVDAIVDKGTFFEMGQHFGRPIITGWRASTDCPSPFSPAIPITTAAPGRPMPAPRPCASSTWPKPFIFPSSISATARAS
jgi:acetyl-CoA carboxylase carboxyltransferase component